MEGGAKKSKEAWRRGQQARARATCCAKREMRPRGGKDGEDSSARARTAAVGCQRRRIFISQDEDEQICAASYEKGGFCKNRVGRASGPGAQAHTRPRQPPPHPIAQAGLGARFSRAKEPRRCTADGASCLARRELGDGLGALGDGVLGELAREHEADGRSGSRGTRASPSWSSGTSLAASRAMRSKMSLMNEFMIDMPFLEMPVSGCTCLSTR